MNMNNNNQKRPPGVSKSAWRRMKLKLRDVNVRPNVVVVPQQQQPYSKKTLKNRAKRARRNARLRARDNPLYNPNRGEDIITRTYVEPLAEISVKHSVHKVLQNHFFPDAGLHRGLAKGSGNSAVSLFRGSTTINTLTTTNNIINFSFLPAFNQTTSLLFINVGAAVTDPYATSTTTIDGIFKSTNPSTDYRVIHASLRLIPSGAFTNQAGEGYVGYVPDSASTGGTSFTRANIDQLAWGMPITGLTNLIMHWVPNDYETDFRGTGYLKNSGIVGYLAVPSTSAAGTQFRMEYQIGVEYLPTAAQRPFVSLAPPEMHPETYYHFNKVVRDMHYPLVAGSFSDFEAISISFSPIALGNPPSSMIGNFTRPNIDRDPILADGVGGRGGYLAPDRVLQEGSFMDRFYPQLAGAAVTGLYGLAARYRQGNRILPVGPRPMMRDL